MENISTEDLKLIIESTTSGPWWIGNTGPEKRMILGGGQSGSYIGTVQVFQTPRHMGEHEESRRIANATLIALAPTLAAEVVRLRHLLSDAIDEVIGLESGAHYERGVRETFEEWIAGNQFLKDARQALSQK